LAPPRPVVWIATTLRHFPHKGLTSEAAFKLLPDHYRQPIEELAAAQLPWEIQMMVTAGGSAARERCQFATNFMRAAESPDNVLLMVDFDIAPSGQQYVDLLCRMASGVDICGGLYTTRDSNGAWVLNRMSGQAPSPSGLLRVLEIGTGFKAFKRSVFDRVIAKNSWLMCVSDHDHRQSVNGFFSMGPVEDPKHWKGRRWLTEDYWFDWLCRRAGIDVVADTRIKLRHRDEVTGELYPAQFPEDPGTLPQEAKET
jgi:hypothetical protein